MKEWASQGQAHAIGNPVGAILMFNILKVIHMAHYNPFFVFVKCGIELTSNNTSGQISYFECVCKM